MVLSISRLVFLSLGVLFSILMLPMFALFASTNIKALASDAVSMFSGIKLANDAYDYGECTYWAALRRIQAGDPIPNTWGNAITWAIRAKNDGYLVDHTPTTGSIMQDPNAPGGLGHVAYVESVNPVNGDWTISEMNRVGWDEVDYRTLTPKDAQSYYFIH